MPRKGESMSSRYGKPEVMPFRDGKLGAFTMQFDDSIAISHADRAIPMINERGLVGTFFVNPGSERYQARRETWEVICPKSGHELANHTWRHEGAKDYAEAEREIGDSSKHIWKLYPGQSKLLPFARGGATEWGITDEQVKELMRRYFLFRRPSLASIRDDAGTSATILTYPQKAMDEHIWFPVHFHGISADHLSTNQEAFVKLLDFLVAHRDQLWVATEGSAYRYQQEYQALSDVSLANESDSSFAVTVVCDATKVDTYDRPFTELYSEPLTVRVAVPDTWSEFTMRQDAHFGKYQAIDIDGRRVAQFEVRPNLGPAVITKD
jgi:peptidoglycan/xylan/chitin deacetylase (PgdA/CDA1 family)